MDEMSDLKEMEKAYQQLITNLSYDDVWLAKLDSFYDSYANAANEKLLHARIVSWKALVLSKMERYKEAIPYYLFNFENEDKQALSFFNTAYGLSFAYFKLGQHNKAVKIIVNFLNTDYPSQDFLKLNMLALYADILAPKNVPAKYEKLVEEIREFIGVDISNSLSLNDRIKEIHRKNKTASVKYSVFLIELYDSDRSKSEKNKLIKEYIRDEEVPFYKKQAADHLAKLEK